ncbi:MAG: SRPBCC family protein [Bradyrhizobium sp.]
MFDLVADVERYPEFVPLCKSLEDPPAHAQAGWHRNRDRRHDRGVQIGARSLHQPGDAGPSPT